MLELLLRQPCTMQQELGWIICLQLSLPLHPSSCLLMRHCDCQVTDNLLTRAYNVGAGAGSIVNSLAQLMFALSASLQGGSVEASTISLNDASLQAFALMSRELGRMIAFLVQTWCQVWLAQSPLSFLGCSSSGI